MIWKLPSLDDFLKARRSNKTWREIAETHGVSRDTLKRAVETHPLYHEVPPEVFDRASTQRDITTEELREMVEVDHMSDEQIAVEIGSKPRAVERLRQRRGIYRRQPGAHSGRKTAEELRLYESLLDEGWSFHMITSEYHVTHETLDRHFPGRAFTRQQTTEAAVMGQRLAKIAA